MTSDEFAKNFLDDEDDYVAEFAKNAMKARCITP